MGVPQLLKITQGNTQNIWLYGLRDKVSNQFWNAAVASATLYDQFGNATSVQSVTLIYQSGSNGDYLGTVTTDSNDPKVGGGYVMKIDAQQGASKFHIEIPTEVIVREDQ